MKFGMLHLLYVIIFSGCVSESLDKQGLAVNNEKLYNIGFVEKLDFRTIAELKRLAKEGSGKAAYKLSTYYDMAGSDSRMSQKYEDTAVKLEYPLAIYNKAVRMWSFDEKPDIQEVWQLLQRAVDLGHTVDGDLLVEVKEAIDTGTIPTNSNFR